MHAQVQPSGTLNGTQQVFTDLTVYPITLTLNRTALLNGFTYYVTVLAGTAYPQHPNSTISSAPIQVCACMHACIYSFTPPRALQAPAAVCCIFLRKMLACSGAAVKQPCSKSRCKQTHAWRLLPERLTRAAAWLASKALLPWL